MDDLPDEPRTAASAEAWARRHVPTPELVQRHPHAAFDADQESGGWAFTTPDRLVMVGRDGSVWVGVRDEEVDRVIDGWLAERRHANRRIDEAALGRCQRLALRLVREGVAPTAVLARVRAEVGGPREVDAVAHLWVRLRRAGARGVDPVRALAGDDDLLAGDGLPEGLLVIACPVCGAPSVTVPRYPRSLCDDCGTRTTCTHDRPVAGSNVSFSGGFGAGHTDGQEPTDCEETTRTGRCRVGDVPCSIGEARFGGIVVQALPDAG